MPDILIGYITEDGRSKIQLHANCRTAWLGQREMVQLPYTGEGNTSAPLNGFYENGEPNLGATNEQSSAVRSEGTKPGLHRGLRR